MAQDPNTWSELLQEFVLKKQNDAANIFMSSLSSLLSNEVSSSVVDLYIISLFNNSSMNIITFIRETLQSKEFKSAKVNALEVIFVLLNNFPQKLEYKSVEIADLCLKALSSLNVSSQEKDKVFSILEVIINKSQTFCESSEYIEQYYKTVFNLWGTYSTSVQGKLTKTIGLLLNKFPYIVENAHNVTNKIITQLHCEVKKSVPSLQLIADSFTALSDIFENFPLETTAASYNVLCECVCTTIVASSNRTFANRALLQFLGKHVVLFEERLIKKLKWWHDKLLYYLSSNNEDQKVAIVTIRSFYAVIMRNICSTYDAKNTDTVKDFVTYFFNTINNSGASNYEIRSSIEGLGVLSKACRMYLPNENVVKIFLDLLQKVQHMYVLNPEPTEDELQYLPAYIDTISAFMKELPEISESSLVCFQHMLILVIRMFPYLSKAHHAMASEAFITSLLHISECRRADFMMSTVTYQGMIWSCSHPYPLDNDESTTDTQRYVKSYKDYLPFYKGLLQLQDVQRHKIDFFTRKNLIERIFDDLIKTLFVLLNKLNLETKMKDDSSVHTSIHTSIDVVKASDYEIFLNLVDIYQDILNHADPLFFKKWVVMFVEQVVQKSLQHPYVSGFYKLLASCLKILDKLNYFNDYKNKENVSICFTTIQSFLIEMLWKMKQYSGDLQIACLTVLISTPCILINDLLTTTAPAFVTLFNIGRSYYRLADIGLDALERWNEHLPASNLNPFLKQVVPSLDSYLRSLSLQQLERSQLGKTRKTKQILKKRKILLEVEPELFNLQQKLLIFLSKLSNDLCYSFVNSGTKVDQAVYSTKKFLKIRLKFEDASFVLYLDRLLPRIIELALYCSNRKIRVNACEVLQATMMIFLGTSRSMGPSQQIQLDEHFRQLFYTALQLGCDLDDPIRNLYQPLVFSMIHWFTHALQFRGPQTAILIETIMEGITHPTNSDLRDFSGLCVKEFVKWTIKQTDPGTLARDPANIKVLVNKIIMFSLHSDPNKRLGAALIFNNIYVDLREEEAIFNMFWLEILYAFIMNISMEDDNSEQEEVCLSQVKDALNHVERGLLEKHKLFSSSSNERRTPPHFRGNLLKDVAFWLLHFINSKSQLCREISVKMFCKIARHTGTVSQYINVLMEGKSINDWILETFEAGLSEKPMPKDSTDIDAVLKWMLKIDCGLHGFLFLINNDVISTSYFKDSNTYLQALTYFLNNLCHKSIKGTMKSLMKVESVFVTVKEKTDFESLKSIITSKTLQLVKELIKFNFHLTEFWEKYMEKGVLNLICYVTFEPYTVGYGPVNNKIQYKALLMDLLQVTLSTSENKFQLKLVSHICSYIHNNYRGNINLQTIIPMKQRKLLEGMLLLKETAFANNFCLLNYERNVTKHVFENLFQTDNMQFCVIGNLDETVYSYCNQKLKLVLEDQQEYASLLECMYSQKEAKYLNSERVTTCGIYFFETFKDAIIPHVLLKFDSLLTTNFTSCTVNFLISVLQYIQDNRKTINSNVTDQVIEKLMMAWGNFETYFEQSHGIVQTGIAYLMKLEAVTVNSQLCLQANKCGISRWVIQLLERDDLNLTSEEKFSFRSAVLDLLPLVTCHTDPENETLRHALRRLEEEYYLHKTEISQVSVVLSLRKLMDALKRSRSMTILFSLIEIYAKTELDIKELDLHETLNIYMIQLNHDLQLRSLEQVYYTCMNVYTKFEQYKVATNVFATLLTKSSMAALEQFLLKHIREVILILNEKNETDDIYCKKAVGYTIIELLFFRVDVNKLGVIANTAFPEKTCTGKEFIKKVMVTTLATFKESLPNEASSEYTELFRLYHCNSYKALASIISNTQKDEAFYVVLFTREADNIDVLWRNLIDLNKIYQFEIDFEKLPSWKNKIVSIRNEVCTRRKKAGRQSASVRYIQSQNLYYSTLSEDVSKFDFTHTTVRTEVEEVKEEDDAVQEIALEAIEINSHECMATLCALINFIVDSGITRVPDPDEEVELPKWMKAITSVLTNNSTHVNIKLFLIKVIQNTRYVFERYANFFYGPIMQFIADGCAGSTMNFFIYDLVDMLVQWSNKTPPTGDRQQASRLLLFLMQNVYSEKHQLYKTNVEVLKLFVEAWKYHMDIPHNFLLSQVKLPLTDPKLDVGVHLTAVLLANNLIPWNPDDAKNFLISLAKILKSEQKVVYRRASETVGLSLRLLSSNEQHKSFLENFIQLMHKTLSEFSKNKNTKDKFIYCLEGIILYYPLFAEKFTAFLVYGLYNIDGHFKLMYLRVLLMCHEKLNPEKSNDLELIDFIALLSDPNLDVQILSLEMIYNCVSYLKDNKLLAILEHVAKFSTNNDVRCREIMFNIFMKVYENFKGSENLTALVELCRTTLLDGLVDKNTNIQERILNFWSDNIPKSVSGRFVQLLQTLYTPPNEKEYLGYSVFLLLEVLKSESSYKENIFENPLEECTLEEYKLVGHWRAQHASVAPLFADTLRSQHVGVDDGDVKLNVLRATKSTFEFEPTQITASQSSYSISSSLLFTQSTDKGNTTFKDPNQVDISHKYKKQRRLLRNKCDVSRRFAYEEIKKAAVREKVRKDQARQKEQGATFYRNYRKGDFPDVQITLSDVLLPMQILAKQDSEFAKQLYILLLNAAINENSNHEFVNDIAENISNIFRVTTNNPSVIGAYLDIALQHKDVIKFDPSIVCDVCKSSGLMFLGTLLLEEYLISGVGNKLDGPSSSKRIRSGEEDEENTHWIQLAELYKEIDELGIVKSIFIEKLNCSEEYLSAITAEAEDNWKEALEAYGKLLQNIPDDGSCRNDLYYESCFRCFAYLSDWEGLTETIKAGICLDDQDSPWIHLWDQSWNQKRLLPWYFRAQVKNVLSKNEELNELMSNLNEALRDSNKYEYLKCNFSEELAILYLINKNVEETKQYIRNSMSLFLETWSTLNPLFRIERLKKLLNIKNTCDIDIFIKKLSSLTPYNYEAVVEKLCKYWLRVSAETPSLVLLETQTLYRKEFLHSLQTKLEQTIADLVEEHEYKEIVKELSKTKFLINFHLLSEALKQNNFYVAKKYYIQQTSAECGADDKLELSLALSKIGFLKRSVYEGEQKLLCLIQSWRSVDPILKSSSLGLDLKLSTFAHIFDIANEISNTCSASTSLLISNINELQSLMPGEQISGADSIRMFGLDKFSSSANACYDHIMLPQSSETLHLQKNTAKAYAKLSYFLIENKEGHERDLIVCVLRAMKLGLAEGIQLFPYILYTCDIGITYNELFLGEVTDVPIWMFLRWIPQLLTDMNTKNIFAIEDILIKIATAYPQSIMYAYRLSKENDVAVEEEVEQANRRLTKKLDELLLTNEVFNKFLKALKAVAMPESILLCHLMKLKQICRERNAHDFNNYSAAILEELYSEKPNSKNADNFFGNMFKKISNYKDQISNLRKRKYNPDTFQNELQKMVNSLNETLKSRSYKPSVILADYCPWLQNFHGAEMDMRLEIPGQYTGHKKPLVQHHITISGFHSKIKSMTSLRRPIRLTILGSDAKEYPYLIKFGEDVRQDQRIEQLFGLMNDIFVYDKDTSQHHLNIATYQVIPLTTSLGIIEWMEDTEVLMQFLNDTSVNANDGKARENYMRWICRSAKSKLDETALYHAACKNYTADQTIANFDALSNLFPWDIFRKAFWQLSYNTESFIALKSNFIRSYAVLCTAHWILGIGDRHLENCMVSLKSGQAVGIDFGHAFGTATQILRIPELVPFRLTPHLVNLMKPIGENGLFKETMIEALNALKRNSDNLLATMDIFIREPSLEWQKYESCYKIVHGESKIDQARQKLKGINPMEIVVKDLKVNVNLEKVVDAYVELARGSDGCVRRSMARDKLTTEEQVKCLIDLATDRNVLGKMYQGFRPWI